MPGLDFIFGKTSSLALLLSQCHPFILNCRGSVHPALNFFRGNYVICSCIFVVSVRGSEFRISLHCHRESSYPNNFNKAFVQTIDFFLTGIFQKKIVYLFSYIY